MSDRMIPVPESALRAAAARHLDAIADLVACLPEPEPTFSDEEALAFYQTVMASIADDTFAIEHGHAYLRRLAKAGWTAPKALCPPPSPALVELVEAARRVTNVAAIALHTDDLARIRAAVAAYDEEG